MDRGNFPPAPTGFSAAGGDFRGRRLSLDSLIKTNPASTFFLRAEEESSLGGCIHPGDILVVDRAAEITNGCLVVAVTDGEMTLRQVVRRQGRSYLYSDPSRAKPGPHSEVQIWGKVVYVLHPVAP
ncbi:MAG: S24 family peptidase [Desulfovermiculus sp.]|nr:S24 family peptidase [Desulfovermiculus sp.]